MYIVFHLHCLPYTSVIYTFSSFCARFLIFAQKHVQLQYLRKACKNNLHPNWGSRCIHNPIRKLDDLKTLRLCHLHECDICGEYCNNSACIMIRLQEHRDEENIKHFALSCTLYVCFMVDTCRYMSRQINLHHAFPTFSIEVLENENDATNFRIDAK